jgi:hypothetical protein
MSMDLSDYRRLVRDLGTWSDTFGIRADARPRIVLRGATESSTFIVGDTSVYRFGKSMVVQRRLPSGGEAYFVLRRQAEGDQPGLVRQGVIGKDVGSSAMAALTTSLTAAAARTRSDAPVVADAAPVSTPALV